MSSFLSHRRKAFRGAFAPTDIAGLDLWLDASDSSTLFDATTGGSTPSDNGSVARWEDKSTNANHATQGTSSLQPLRRVSEVNGLDAIDFISSDVLEGAVAITPRQTDAKTVFILLESDTTTAGVTPVNLYSYGVTPVLGKPALITVEVAYRAAGRTWVSSSPVSTTGASLITMTHDGQTNIEDSLSFWLDGASVTKTSGVDGALVDDTANYHVGRQASSTSGGDYDGRLCEIIVYDTELSTADREAVETYLADKWGITI